MSAGEGEEDEVMKVVNWRGAGATGRQHKITVQPNGSGWLVLKQSKRNREWTVDESWHSDDCPRLIGGDGQ